MTSTPFRRHLLAACLAFGTGLLAQPVFAQANAPLRVILPVGPGSGVDVIAASRS